MNDDHHDNRYEDDGLIHSSVAALAYAHECRDDHGCGETPCVCRPYLNEPFDFRARLEGSLVLLTPQTNAARAWISEHLPDNAQWFAGAIVIESRYFESISGGIGYVPLTINYL